MCQASVATLDSRQRSPSPADTSAALLRASFQAAAGEGGQSGLPTQVSSEWLGQVTVRDVKRNPRTAYLQSTRAPILILFFYFSYYLTVVATTYLSEYGASIDPRLWMNASAMGCMVGVALNSCAISPGQSVGTYLGEAPLRCLRFFIIPFCVSSISSLVMGVNYAATARGVPPVFFLVFPTGTHQLATCFGVPTLVALSLVIVRRLLALPGERSGYIVDSVSDPDDDPDTEESIYLPQVLLHRSPENPLQQEPGDLDSMEKGPPPAAPSRRVARGASAAQSRVELSRAASHDLGRSY